MASSAYLKRKALGSLMKRKKFSCLLRPIYILLLFPVVLLTIRSFLWVIHPQYQSFSEAPLRHRDEAKSIVLPKCSKATNNRAKSFVILFMGHSGSTALISALHQHPQVYIDGYEPVDHGDIAKNTRQALEYARAFFETGVEMNKTAGFKIRPRHILKAPREWAELFDEFDTKIIWNYRANIFKQAVGHYPIMYLNDVSRYEGLSLKSEKDSKKKKKNHHVGEFKIHDMTAFYKLLSSRYRGEQQVENAVVSLKNNACVLPLSYELLLENPVQTPLIIQSFLNLRVIRSLQPARRKATDDNMCKVVSNWNEVCNAFFLCHRWRGMMDDTRTGCTCPVVTGIKPSHAHRFCDPEKKVSVSKNRLKKGGKGPRQSRNNRHSLQTKERPFMKKSDPIEREQEQSSGK